MFFIGQDHIMPALGEILMYVYDNKKGVNILFRGASGCGKTELAKRSCNFLVGENYQYCLGDNIKFDRNVFVHFIDEAHLIKNSEVLYPLMDSGNFVFIFATNFDSILPEALTNRCNNFIFSDYSDRDLIDIFKYHCRLQVSDEIIKYLINISGRNPRIIVNTFAKVLEMHYRGENNILNYNDEQIIKTINNLFGIENGLDRTCRQYLESLNALGGRASINLIAATMKLDLNTIKYSIEPILLYKNAIKISQRGRELCHLQ